MRTFHRPLLLVVLALAIAGCDPTRSTEPPSPARLTGVVVGADGLPRAGVDVDAQSLRAIDGRIQYVFTSTGADGSFDFGPVAPADWLVGAHDDSLAAADTVRVPAAARLVLRRSCAVRGRVLHPGASDLTGITVLSDLAWQGASPDSAGAYVLGGLPTGGWFVYAVRPPGSYGVVRVAIAAPGDTATAPDLVLAP
jgi:hypothetical protein